MKHLLSPITLALIACSGATSPIDYATLQLSIIAGNVQADTVTKRLSEALVVRVTESGQPRAGVLINFVVVEDGCGAAFAPSVQTNDAGEAQNFWDLGTLAGPCSMEARAIDASGNPVTFGRFTATAIPGTATQFFLTNPLQMWHAHSITFADDAVQDVYGNAIGYTIATTGAGGATNRTITGSPFGRGTYEVLRDGRSISTSSLGIAPDPTIHELWRMELTCTTADTTYHDIFRFVGRPNFNLRPVNGNWRPGVRHRYVIANTADTIYNSELDVDAGIYTGRATRLRRLSLSYLFEDDALSITSVASIMTMLVDGVDAPIQDIPLLGVADRGEFVFKDSTAVVQACIGDGFLGSTLGVWSIERQF